MEPRPATQQARLSEGNGHAPALPAAQPRDDSTALIHLYRGEMGRLTAFRTRLDTTTSWTVTSVTIVTTFGLTNNEVPQGAFLFLMFALLFFLNLESQRYIAYEASRHKVLLLERFFFPETMGYPTNPTWRDQLVEALRKPQLQLNYFGAVGRRLRRTYLWVYLAVAVIWVGKLHIKAGGTWALDRLVARAAIGAVPGEAVFALVGLFYLALILLAIFARRSYPLADERAEALLKATPED